MRIFVKGGMLRSRISLDVIKRRCSSRSDVQPTDPGVEDNSSKASDNAKSARRECPVRAVRQ